MATENKVNLIETIDLLTPTQLLNEYPECGLRRQDLGFLLRFGAVTGEKVGERGTRIERTSFVRFLEYREKVPKLRHCMVA